MTNAHRRELRSITLMAITCLLSGITIGMSLTTVVFVLTR